MSFVRSLAKQVVKAAIYPGARLLDRRYLAADVPAPSHRTSHSGMRDHVVELGSKTGMRVLEIGSREVTGSHSLKARLEGSGAEYVGFDYYAGANVDVVGDAHKLSTYFDEPFDIVYSTAVFEHLAMPWVAAEEIAKVLKVGGFAFTETHFSTSVHERPWHFFQFSDMALRALFSPTLGFECVEASMSNPIVGRYSILADPYLRLRPVEGLYCHSAIMARKVREVSDHDWRSVDIDDVTGATHYPAGTGVSGRGESMTTS
ncbi:class I SAM-dependent methyltransferase [uncultured Sphingomonas sp.]|uniref:class I SAM-dependent methyltransferase n=1 Tax=uncultured Sphingomonas sp. TaxID=158754 RepID=UPI0035CC7CD2